MMRELSLYGFCMADIVRGNRLSATRIVNRGHRYWRLEKVLPIIIGLYY